MSGTQAALNVELPARLRERLNNQLRVGERFLWLGQPNVGRMARRAALRAVFAVLATIIVSLGLLGIGVMWPLANPGWIVQPWLWWTACGSAGFAALAICAWTLVASRIACRTGYAVSNLRVCVCRHFIYSRDWSIDRADIQMVRVRTWPGARGEILFESRLEYGNRSFAELEGKNFLYLDDVAGARHAVELMLGREVAEESFRTSRDDAHLSLDRPGTEDVSPALRERLIGELAEDERILWIGHPPPNVMMLRAAIPVGCVFLALAGGASLVTLVAWLVESNFPAMTGMLRIAWVLAPVVIVAAFAFVLRPLFARYRAQRTAYVVTERRALIVHVGLGGRIYSYGRTALDELEVRMLHDGSGEVIFEQQVRVHRSDSDSGGEYRRIHVVGFIEVCQVEPARQALEKMLGRSLPAVSVAAVSLNQHHTI